MVEMLCEKINLPKTETLDLLREPQFWEIMNLHKEGKMREMFELLLSIIKETPFMVLLIGILKC